MKNNTQTKVKNLPIIELTLPERIFLSTSFRPKGTIFSLRIIKDIQSKIEFSQPDIKKFKLQQNGEIITFDTKFLGTTFKYSFTDLEMNEIKLCLKQIDKEGEMHISMLDLCDKFNVTSE